MLKHTITDSCLTLVDSYKVRKSKFASELKQIKNLHPKSKVWEREKTMPKEWACHNFIYSLGMFKSHTCNVDFEHPQKSLLRIAYQVMGSIVWPLIK